jgi:hypothetical protein
MSAKTGAKMKAQKRWGNWVLNEDNLTLEHYRPGYKSWDYWVDLERCVTPAALLDWIFQILDRSFGGTEDIANFLRAVDDILYPQANLCSFGSSKQITGEQLKRLVEECSCRSVKKTG